MCVRTIARIVFAAFLVAGPVVFAKGDEPQNVSAKAGSPTIDLAFAGDIMLAELPGEMIARGEDPFSSFAEVLRKVDLAIGNLECVVATGGTEYDKPYVFRAHPRVLKTVKRHLDIVCLANNHTGDYGHSAFLEQLDLLEQHQLLYVGGGRNCAQARKPLLIDHQGFRIALLAYNDFKPRAFEAGPSWPGVAWAVDAQIVADIEAARTIHKADLVIPMLHWGWEYEPANEREKALARVMIDAGADMVVGGHPHVTQEVEYYNGKLIVYSIGNFIFNGFDPGPSRIGWVLRTRLNKQGLVAWDTLVGKIDEQGQPHLQSDATSPAGTNATEPIVEVKGLTESPFVKSQSQTQ